MLAAAAAAVVVVEEDRVRVWESVRVYVCCCVQEDVHTIVASEEE